MESVVAIVVSLLFKALDKYVVYNMATSSIIPKICLFSIFTLVESVIMFSILENILEDVIKASFKFYKNKIPLSSQLDIQSFLSLLISIHSVINKILIWSGFSFFDSILLASLVLFGVFIIILEEYGQVRRFIPIKELSNYKNKQRYKIEDSAKDLVSQDSFVVISFEDENTVQSRNQATTNGINDTQNLKNEIREQKQTISYFYWTCYMIYLILIKLTLRSHSNASSGDFIKFKYMLIDLAFIFPLLSNSFSIPQIQQNCFLLVNILSQLVIINFSDINLLVIYSTVIFIIQRYRNNMLHLIITITILIFFNDFILSFIIHQTRMHFSVKLMFNIIGLLMICFFYRVTHKGLIYASFFPAMQFVLYMIWLFIFVFHIEKQVYSTSSYLTDLIKEQAGLVILLTFEAAILKKISLKISEYLNTKQDLQYNSPHELQINILYEILNDHIFQIIWQQDNLMKISLKKMNKIQFFVASSFIHLFFGSSNILSFLAYQIILNSIFWVSSISNKRYTTFSLISFSLCIKYCMSRGLNFILEAIFNCILMIFSWKKSLLANLLPVMFENYVKTKSLENDPFQLIGSKLSQTSNYEVFIVSLTLLSAIGFMLPNSKINNLTKRIRDLLVPFIVHFLIFQQASSYSKYISLNLMLSFVADLGILTKDF